MATWLVAQLFGVVLLLGAAEGLSRLLSGDEPTPIFADPDLATRDRPFVRSEERRGFTLVAGFRSSSIRVNQHGFRGAELPDDLERRFVVIAVGDSATFGWRVANGLDYPSRLEEALRERGVEGVLVVNAGIPSYTSTQVLLYLEEILGASVLDPDLVVVNAVWNDIYYSMGPRWHRDQLVPRLPPPWLAFGLEHSRLIRALVHGRATAGEWHAFREPARVHYAENVERMIDACRAAEVPIALVEPAFSPSRFDVPPGEELRFTREDFLALAAAYRETLEDVARRRDVPLLRHALTWEHDRAALFLDAIHPNARGNRHLGRDLAKMLVEGGWVPTAPSARGPRPGSGIPQGAPTP